MKFRQSDPVCIEYEAAQRSTKVTEIVYAARRIESAAIAAGTSADGPLYYQTSTELFLRAESLLLGETKWW